jgi:hypothetical protein
MDLGMPAGNWMERAAAWKSLTDRLFTSLRGDMAAQRAFNIAQLRRELETWEPFIKFSDEQREKRLDQWETARCLLVCTKLAINLPRELNSTELDPVVCALDVTPEFIKSREGWAFDCVSILYEARGLRQLRPPTRSLHVPLALSDELLQDKGSLATIVLDVLQPGAGRVFHHPAYSSLISYADPDFEESMQDAWDAAKDRLRKDGVNVPLCDGRWRLVLEERPVPAIRGRSASGAAAWGWWFALQERKVPDKEIIVLAEINKDGDLKEVGGLFAKTNAIAEDGRFDTIVVASEKNRLEAEKTLRKLGRLGPIRVVRLGGGDA